MDNLWFMDKLRNVWLFHLKITTSSREKADDYLLHLNMSEEAIMYSWL